MMILPLFLGVTFRRKYQKLPFMLIFFKSYYYLCVKITIMSKKATIKTKGIDNKTFEV